MRFTWPWRKTPAATQPEPERKPAAEQEWLKISQVLLGKLDVVAKESRDLTPKLEIKPHEVMPGVVPNQHRLAMDEQAAPAYAYACQAFEGMGFYGYPRLAELAQVAEYRQMAGRLASEMTRKWIKLKSSGNSDKSKRIKAINAALLRFNVRELFRECAENDGFFGRCQLFVNIKDVVAGSELEKPLVLDSRKIAKGDLRGFRVVEPITTYPGDYNSTNPLRADYFAPTTWYVMGQKIHATRLMMFASRTLPDMLKPAYNFGGISLSQLAQPAVDNWLRTRDNAGKLLRNFSTVCYGTDLASLLNGGAGETVLDRAKLFTKMRDNLGLMILDKDREQFFEIHTPLSGVDKLQAQAQEHMAAVAQTPLVVLLGITPSGLNASSDGEIRVFYDYVKDMQEILFRGPLEDVIKLVQLNEFGEIDESITFDFEPLYQMNEAEQARIRKADADAGIEYIGAGVISPLEERKRLAADPASGYSELDVEAELPPTDPAITEKKDALIAAVKGLDDAEEGGR